MKRFYSVEIDRYNPMALVHCLELLNKCIPDFEYSWIVSANGGGIDYGLFLNVDIYAKEITYCNQPMYGDGDDTLEDILENFSENDEE